VGLISLILIPLIAGYAFNVSFFVSRYISSRESGYRLYFRAAYYGMILLVLAVLVYLYMVSFPSLREAYGLYAPISKEAFLGDMLIEKSQRQLQFSMMIVVSIAFVLGISLGQLFTVFFSLTFWFDNQYERNIPILSRLLRLQAYYLEWAIRNDDFEKLLLRSVKETLQVCFTMGSGKVYVGYVVRSIDPAEEHTHVRILPMRSGQRGADGCIQFTTYYSEHYTQIINADSNGESVDDAVMFAGNYELVFPMAEIVSANIFLDEVYDRIQETGVLQSNSEATTMPAIHDENTPVAENEQDIRG
jgi:hypothetical protein